MTIKQQGGIFGRNPSFNDVEANQGTFADLASTTSMVSGGTNKTVGSYGNSHVRSDSNAAAYNGGNLSFGGKSVATGGQYIFGGLKFMSDPASGTGWDTYSSLYLTNADSSVSEKVFFKNNGDINPTGNIVVNSGKGIDFSATSGTGTSELFDDYEEGEFGATLTPKTSGTITLNSSYNTLAYTKVGRLVTVTGMLIVSSVGSPVGTDFTVDGLPFVIADLGEAAGRFGGAISFSRGSTVTAEPIRGFEGGTTITVAKDASTVGANDQLYIQFTYMTA